ncbi:MAG: hypothetical protein HYZ28_18195 [Myxococcales bacterium]|nr:hypothetical protein [Myxococcales bacterium]
MRLSTLGQRKRWVPMGGGLALVLGAVAAFAALGVPGQHGCGGVDESGRPVTPLEVTPEPEKDLTAGAFSARKVEDGPGTTRQEVINNGWINNGWINNGWINNGWINNGFINNGWINNGWINNGLTNTGSGTTNTDIRNVVADANTRNFIKYVVECALPKGHTLTLQDKYGTNWTFAGAVGLAPEWETGACYQECQRWVSGCLIARQNNRGSAIPLSMRKPPSLRNNGYADALNKLGSYEASDFPYQEGAFWGNVFQVDLNKAPKPVAYACFGSGNITLRQQYLMGLSDRVLADNGLPGAALIGTCEDLGYYAYYADKAQRACGSTDGNGTFYNCGLRDLVDGVPAGDGVAYNQVITIYRGPGPAKPHSDYTTGAALPAASSPCAYKVAREIKTSWGATGDGYCASSGWDGVCKNEAADLCGAHSVRAEGAPLSPADSDCIKLVCTGYLNSTYPSGDSYCCSNRWDWQCTQEAKTYCAL